MTNNWVSTDSTIDPGTQRLLEITERLWKELPQIPANSEASKKHAVSDIPSSTCSDILGAWESGNEELLKLEDSRKAHPVPAQVALRGGLVRLHPNGYSRPSGCNR